MGLSLSSSDPEAPSLVERVYRCSDWRWQELELGTYQEVCDAAEYIRWLKKGFDPALAWQLEWYLVRADLWYLLRYVSSMGHWIELGTAGVVHEKWLYDRCREVEAKCDRVVDIWSRFHWKSYIKTILKMIQEALRDSAVTTVTFSHTRPIAKAFLSSIKQEIMSNETLIDLSWDPILDRNLYSSQKIDYGQLSLDNGITIPRFGSAKEATFSAFGLVDSLPTGGHWVIRNLDDAVTKDSVTTPEQIAKVQHAWELSIPLGMPAGRSEEWVEGTFYNLGDLYHTMTRVRDYELRLHPCYEVDWEGTQKDDKGQISRLRLFFDGEPVLYEKKKIEKFEKDMGKKEGSANLSMQLYCDPNAGEGSRSFEREWLTFYDPKERTPQQLIASGNCLILVDSAGQKRSGSDFTAMWTLSLQDDGCAYAVDMAREKLSLTERGEQLLRMHQRCARTFYECRYERYGAMSDIEYVDDLCKRKKRRMRIVRVGGLTDKDERIQRLIPWFENGKLVLPEKFMYRRTTGERVDLVEEFIHDEYLPFPNNPYKDMLDSLSRLCDQEGALNRGGTEGKKIPLRLRFPSPEEPVIPVDPMEAYPDLGDRMRKDRKRKKTSISREKRWLVA